MLDQSNWEESELCIREPGNLKVRLDSFSNGLEKKLKRALIYFNEQHFVFNELPVPFQVFY